jgi:hypothetical protein
MLDKWRSGFKQLKSKYVCSFCHRTFCLVKCCVGFRAFSSAVSVYIACRSLWWNKCSYVMLKDSVTYALYIHLSSALSVGSRILQCKIRSSHVRGYEYMIRHRWHSQYEAHSTENVSVWNWMEHVTLGLILRTPVCFKDAMYLCVSYDSQNKINYFSTQHGEVRLGFGNSLISDG